MNTRFFLAKMLSLWLFVFSILPGLFLFVLGFFTQDLTTFAKLPLTLHHYLDLFNPFFFKILIRSLFLAGLATLICFLLAYPFAYFLLKLKHKTLIIVLIIIPFWTSSLVRTFAMVDLLKSHGAINHILLKLGIIQNPLSLLYTNEAVLIGLVYNLLPFMILPIYNAMHRIDKKWIDAGFDLGASKWQIFTRLFWPLTKSGSSNGCIMVFLPAMTLFYIPNILGGAKSILIGNLIQNEFLFLNNWPQGAASSSLLTLILIGFFYFQQIKEKNP
ncbi:MAG: ABC transporter permease [Gammaproteobacteria bacterium]|nr:ABC transporter permease [Gammaproteobacteria bacterium]